MWMACGRQVGQLQVQCLIQDASNKGKSIDSFNRSDVCSFIHFTGGNTAHYSYDPNQRLVAADDGASSLGFRYDAAGIRIAREDGAGATHYLVDHNRDYAQVLEEQDSFGTTEARYTHGLDLLSQSQAGSTSWFHTDGLGSTRKLTDASGAVTDSYTYTAFGELEAVNGSTSNDYLFTGEQFDEGLEQYYLRARYYDPASGRFTQMDKFPGLDTLPGSLHKFVYVQNQPVFYTDASGLSFLIGESIASNIRAVQTGASTVSYRYALKQVGQELVCIGIEEVISTAILEVLSSGIYVLLDGSDLYIGRSTDIERRIIQHAKDSTKRISAIAARFHFVGLAEKLPVIEQFFASFEI